MRILINRNLKLYFRDRTSVIFSMSAVLIILVCYILFLGKMQVDAVAERTNGLIKTRDIEYLVNTWILAGVLSVTTVTSTLGAFGQMVKDRESRILMDFKSAPLKDYIYPLSYIISSFLVGILMSGLTFMGYSFYITIKTGYLFSLWQTAQAAMIIILSCSFSATFMGFIVSLLSTFNAYNAMSLIIASIIGFLNGLYSPMGMMPKIIQKIVVILPFMHIASILRKILMVDALEICFGEFPEEVLQTYVKNYGIRIFWNDIDIRARISIIFIVVLTLQAIACLVESYRHKKKSV
ncbi:ABC transporter permease [Clostridia bacterium]|nr:ABC transporter permease [Clostridia bacterium]